MNYKPTDVISLRDIDIGHYFRHYLDLMWRWKWWIFVVFPVVFLISLIVTLKVSYENPKLSTQALIGLEDVSDVASVQDIGGFENKKTELMKTRVFLAEIVKKLSLQLQIKRYHRHVIFDNVHVDSAAIPGKYEFKISNDGSNQYMVLFQARKSKDTPFWKKAKSRMVQSGRLSSLKSLEFQGVNLTLTEGFVKNPHDLEFYVLNMRFAIEYILAELKVNPFPHRGNISISFTGKDYNLISQVVNSISDAFVEKQLIYKKTKTKMVIEALESQLAKSKQELTKSENKIKNFRLSNPSIGLDEGARRTVESLINLETHVYSINNVLKEARRLRSRYMAAFKEDKEQVGLEIVLFLIANKISSASIFRANLERQVAEKRKLEEMLAKDHPNLKQNQEEIDKTINNVYSTLLAFIKDTENRVRQRTAGIKNVSDKLRGLPSKELQLAELERSQNIASGIYTQVLDRYNKAKVAETVETADVFIMEYAIPPIPPPNRTLLLIALGISLLFALGTGFGPPVIFDLFNRTARTEFELAKMTDMVVLECIPEIMPKKGKKEGD